MFPVVNVISLSPLDQQLLRFSPLDQQLLRFSPLDQQLLRFSPLDHVTEIMCYLFRSVQFDFEEGNFESGFGIKLLLSFAIAT